MKNRGTRDQIANLRWIMVRQREYNQEVHICYIDYSKAFDCVDNNIMWNALRQMGFPEHLIHLIKNLYNNQESVVLTEVGDTDILASRKAYAKDVFCLLCYSISMQIRS